VAIQSNLKQAEGHERVPLRFRWEKLGSILIFNNQLYYNGYVFYV
jgi:hypothetical protein